MRQGPPDANIWGALFGGASQCGASEVVGHFHDSGGPEYMEMFLVHAIAYPIEWHSDGAVALLFDVLVGNDASCGVVNLDGMGGCRWPISCSIIQHMVSSFIFVNSPAVSASAVDERKTQMTPMSLRMAPLDVVS